ncbi:MAG: type III-B CRISPR module RAMP protein Cmr1 [Desulfonauticus sp.]|nr:type III-B CRISPR module RAMP protein Cmr1 [Desulfonauticus sp.]
MKKIYLLCKTITPLFMGGATINKPELRPSGFKGTMRFWWRALKCEDNISKLREEESNIFGGTQEKEGKSKVMLRIRPQSVLQGENIKKDYGLRWDFNKTEHRLTGKDMGIGYLLYSTVLPNRERKYFKTDSTFKIELLSRDDITFKNALAALWTSIYLGGFGTRSRRGGGNIVVEKIEGDALGLEFIPLVKDAKNISHWLKKNLEVCFEFITGEKKPKNFTSSYSNLSFARIIISSKSKTTWKDALNEIGVKFADFRYRTKKDVFDSAIFGLPVQHKNSIKVEGKIHNRRSSPLIIKILKTQNSYYWITIRLTGEFLPQGDVLALKEKFNITKTQKPNFKLIDEFWNNIQKDNREQILSFPKILDNIKKNIIKHNPSAKIILFGSRARGDAYKTSDIDIAIDTDKAIGELDLIGPIDIVNLKKAPDDLKNIVKTEGVIL